MSDKASMDKKKKNKKRRPPAPDKRASDGDQQHHRDADDFDPRARRTEYPDGDTDVIDPHKASDQSV